MKLKLVIGAVAAARNEYSTSKAENVGHDDCKARVLFGNQDKRGQNLGIILMGDQLKRQLEILLQALSSLSILGSLGTSTFLGRAG
jgi:hypothetical protein